MISRGSIYRGIGILILSISLALLPDAFLSAREPSVSGAEPSNPNQETTEYKKTTENSGITENQVTIENQKITENLGANGYILEEFETVQVAK